MDRVTSDSPSLRPLRVAVILAVLVGFYFLLAQLGQVRSLLPVLRAASWGWIAVAIAGAAISVVASVFTQWAAGNWAGSYRYMILLELAGSFLNHFLPFNIGGTGLMTKYYQRLGLSSVRAVTVSVLPVPFGILTTVCLLAVVSPVTLSHYLKGLHFGMYTRWLVLAAAIAGLVALIRYWRYVKIWLSEAWDGLRGIRSSRQLMAIVGGSLVITLSVASALYASVMAAHGSVALAYLITLFVAASLSTSLVPTPGGIGATETVLIVGLSGAGMPLPQAVASTLIFRFITFWLPLLPGAVALYIFNRLPKRGAPA